MAISFTKLMLVLASVASCAIAAPVEKTPLDQQLSHVLRSAAPAASHSNTPDPDKPSLLPRDGVDTKGLWDANGTKDNIPVWSGGPKIEDNIYSRDGIDAKKLRELIGIPHDFPHIGPPIPSPAPAAAPIKPPVPKEKEGIIPRDTVCIPCIPRPWPLDDFPEQDPKSNEKLSSRDGVNGKSLRELYETSGVIPARFPYDNIIDVIPRNVVDAKKLQELHDLEHSIPKVARPTPNGTGKAAKEEAM